MMRAVSLGCIVLDVPNSQHTVALVGFGGRFVMHTIRWSSL